MLMRRRQVSAPTFKSPTAKTELLLQADHNQRKQDRPASSTSDGVLLRSRPSPRARRSQKRAGAAMPKPTSPSASPKAMAPTPPTAVLLPGSPCLVPTGDLRQSSLSSASTPTTPLSTYSSPPFRSASSPHSVSPPPFMLGDPQPLPPALPELHRSASATRMQAAYRKHAARLCLHRLRHAVIVVQSLLRGWRARRGMERWHSAIRAVLTDDNLAERAVEITASCASPHLQHDTEVPELRMSQIRRSSAGRSQKLTLRLRDDGFGVGAPFRSRAEAHSPSHFDVVVARDTTLHDGLYESGKRHFAAGLFERALVDFHLTLHHLEKIERRNAKAEDRTPRFDPESTGFRNLDDCARWRVGMDRMTPSPCMLLIPPSLERVLYSESLDGTHLVWQISTSATWGSSAVGAVRCPTSVMTVAVSKWRAVPFVHSSRSCKCAYARVRCALAQPSPSATTASFT